MGKKIKVLIVDDSKVFREVMAKGLSSDQDIEIVAVAKDPFEARDMILKFEPDVMTCDIEMPKMNGIEFIKRLIPQYPILVIVVSTIDDAVFDAMRAGAVDYVLKPSLDFCITVEKFIKEMISKVKIASQAQIQVTKSSAAQGSIHQGNIHQGSIHQGSIHKNAIHQNSMHQNEIRQGTSKQGNVQQSGLQRISSEETRTDRNIIIAIGASTGGTEAIYSVLKNLPPNCPGIVIVQHIPPVFSKMFADRINSQTQLRCREAKDGDYVETGTVLVAPGNQHLTVKKAGDRYKVNVFMGEKVNGHCPSVDLMFESVAKEAGSSAIGIILTGMGYDGAKGLLSMRRKGARTIGQDEESSVVYGMPKTAYNIGAVEKQVALGNIPNAIISILKEKGI